MLYQPETEELVCPNCGTKAIEAATSSISRTFANNTRENISPLFCQVCHFDLRQSTEKEPGLSGSSTDLEAMVHDLLLKARNQGVDSAEIVQILREELEFAVELDRTGRRFSVQIIDLGSDEQSQSMLNLTHNNRDLINSRTFDQ